MFPPVAPHTVAQEPPQIARFRALLQQAENAPSRRYFILQSIITSNLYGVDLMEEAVEVCKLRLSLKLLAQVEKPEDWNGGSLSSLLRSLLNVFDGQRTGRF